MWQYFVPLTNVHILIAVYRTHCAVELFFPVFYFTTVSHWVHAWNWVTCRMCFDATSYWRGWNWRQLLQRFPERLQTKSSKHLCDCTLCYLFSTSSIEVRNTHGIDVCQAMLYHSDKLLAKSQEEETHKGCKLYLILLAMHIGGKNKKCNSRSHWIFECYHSNSSCLILNSKRVAGHFAAMETPKSTGILMSNKQISSLGGCGWGGIVLFWINEWE